MNVAVFLQLNDCEILSIFVLSRKFWWNEVFAEDTSSSNFSELKELCLLYVYQEYGEIEI